MASSAQSVSSSRKSARWSLTRAPGGRRDALPNRVGQQDADEPDLQRQRVSELEVRIFP